MPAAALRATFVYRHRQLSDDLAAHREAADAGMRPMTVAVTGASGLVGSALVAFLTTGGHRVIRLVRGPAANSDERHWEPTAPAADLLDDVDAVIHLAGASIAGRFTDAHRTRHPRQSDRADPQTRGVAARASNGPRVFVSASAVGYYGFDRGDAILTEDSDRGDGFLADVVADWEAATAPAAEAGLRVVTVRTGIVQAARGGTLKLLRPLFAAGLGGRLGSGSQWMSWIGIDDLVDVYHRALYDDRLVGPVNAVAPNPLRNSEYTKALGGVLHRPTIVPVPSFGPKLLLGAQGARELAEADRTGVAREAPGGGAPLSAAARRGRASSPTRSRLTHDPIGESPHQPADPRGRAGLHFGCCREQFIGGDPGRDDLSVAVGGEPALQQRRG